MGSFERVRACLSGGIFMSVWKWKHIFPPHELFPSMCAMPPTFFLSFFHFISFPFFCLSFFLLSLFSSFLFIFPFFFLSFYFPIFLSFFRVLNF
jgi:hypothetical protein